MKTQTWYENKTGAVQTVGGKLLQPGEGTMVEDGSKDLINPAGVPTYNQDGTLNLGKSLGKKPVYLRDDGKLVDKDGALVDGGGSSAVSRTTVQLAAAPTATDITLGDSATFYDSLDPTKRYSMNAAHTTFVLLSGSSSSTGITRIVGTNQRWPLTLDQLGGNGTTGSVYRIPCQIGTGRAKNLRLFFPTFVNVNQGDKPMSACTIQEAALEYNGMNCPVKFGGSLTRAVAAGELGPNGEAGIWSDILDIKTAFGSEFLNISSDVFRRVKMLRALDTDTVGHGWLIAQDSRAYAAFFDPTKITAMSSMYSVGQLNIKATGGLFTQPYGYEPILCGEFVNEGAPDFAVALNFGDSTADAGNDTTWPVPFRSGRGTMRATYGKNGKTNPIAGITVACPGNGIQAMRGANNLTHFIFALITHGNVNIGLNDLGALNGSTNRNIWTGFQANKRGLYADMRAKNPTIKIADWLTTPVVTASSDVFTSDTGQTIGAEWGMTNGATAGDTVGLGEYYRTWQIDQTNPNPTIFTGNTVGSFLNVTAIPAQTAGGSGRIYIGMRLSGPGFPDGCTIIGMNDAAKYTNGVAQYTISPAPSANIASTTMQAVVSNPIDYIIQDSRINYPNRRDLWALASTAVSDLPNGATTMGVPPLNGTGSNHPGTNQYYLMARNMRYDFYGRTD